MVHYTTAEEYKAETGAEWGNAGARARLGARAGRIWVKVDSPTEHRPLNQSGFGTRATP